MARSANPHSGFVMVKRGEQQTGAFVCKTALNAHRTLTHCREQLCWQRDANSRFEPQTFQACHRQDDGVIIAAIEF
jgi:hypothetical protein